MADHLSYDGALASLLAMRGQAVSVLLVRRPVAPQLGLQRLLSLVGALQPHDPERAPLPESRYTVRAPSASDRAWIVGAAVRSGGPDSGGGSFVLPRDDFLDACWTPGPPRTLYVGLRGDLVLVVTPLT